MALFFNRLIPLFSLLFLLVINQLTLASQNRIALVIGNSSYKNASLKNPVNDAMDMSQKLKKFGFTVKHLKNANQHQMEDAIRNFGTKLSQKNSVGLFYYAGHGVQVNDRNYLIPIGARIEKVTDVKYQSVDAGRILDEMEVAGNGLNMMILDACRNNPFSRSFSRSHPRGLAKMHAPNGSIILYATSPGDIASDGNGRNGLFTEKLMQAMDEKGLKIEDVFKKTAIKVNQSSGKKQIPYFEGVILGDFYFNGSVTVNQAPLQLASADPDIASKMERDFWLAVQENPSKEMYEAYLTEYHKGHYAPIARINLKQLNKQKKPELKPVVTHAKLTIRSNVNNDTVKINGEAKGSTRLDIKLKSGIYELEISKEGYTSWERSLQIKAGQNQMVYAKLNKTVQPVQTASYNKSKPQIKASSGASINPGSLSKNLVAYYKLDGNTNDSSGNGNHGIESGGINYTEGKIGQSADFDGIDDLITLPRSPNLIFQNKSVSVSTWMLAKEANLTVQAVSSYWSVSGDPKVIAIGLNTGIINAIFRDHPSTHENEGLSDTSSVNVNQWYHVVITFDNNTYQQTMYVNGNKVDERLVSGIGDFDDGHDFRLGSAVWNSNPLFGKVKVDEVKFYNRALSESEIKQLANP
jgi:hypothetical protein